MPEANVASTRLRPSVQGLMSLFTTGHVCHLMLSRLVDSRDVNPLYLDSVMWHIHVCFDRRLAGKSGLASSCLVFFLLLLHIALGKHSQVKCVLVTPICFSVCLSLHCCTDPDVTSGNGRRCPLVVHYWAISARVPLLCQHT